MPIGDLYTVTSVQGVFPEPPAILPICSSFCTIHHQQNKGAAVPVWLQQAYLPCFRCCLLLTLNGRGFILSDFSFLRVYLSGLSLEWEQAGGHHLVEIQLILGDVAHHTRFITGGSRVIKSWVVCYCLSFAFRKGDGWKEVAWGLKLDQQSLKQRST